MAAAIQLHFFSILSVTMSETALNEKHTLLYKRFHGLSDASLGVLSPAYYDSTLWVRRATGLADFFLYLCPSV